MTPQVKDRTFWVLGLARSGCAAAGLLRRHGARVIGLDDADEDAVGRRWEREGLSDLAPRAFDELLTGGRRPSADPVAIVISPGVPPTHPALKSLPASVEVMGELELGARFCRARLAAVTGTNGKTTTTEWLAHLARRAGLEAHALGNVGRPLCSIADRLGPDDLAVLEVSSFQLEAVREFAPEVGILLNLAPDHLDRYPDVAAYYAAKRPIAANVREGGSFVTWTGCGIGRDWATPGRLRLFGDAAAGAEVYYDQGEMYIPDGNGSRPLLPAGSLSLQSPPNRLNALACTTAALALGLPGEAFASGLQDFPGLAHRHEPVARRGNVRFINDTKATNVHAVCSGLQDIARPVVLIVGGSGKGEDYAPLREVMGGVRAAILLGQEGPAIGAVIGDRVETLRAGSMEEAVAQADRIAQADGQGHTDVLLSPACASFDQFPNYRARGEAFLAAALAIGAEPLPREAAEG